MNLKSFSVLVLSLFFFITAMGCSIMPHRQGMSRHLLYSSVIADYKGETYIIGGYYGEQNRRIPNRYIYKIPDREEAFFYRNGLKGFWSGGVQVKDFIIAGMLSPDIILPMETYWDTAVSVLDDTIYLISGSNDNIKEVITSRDMLKWERLLKKDPGNSRFKSGIKSGVFNGFIYAATRNGNVFRSTDGLSWENVFSFNGAPLQLLEFKGRFFISFRERSQHFSLHSTSDGLNWNIENKFPGGKIVFSEKRAFAVDSSSIYISYDCKEWKMLINSPVFDSSCGMYNDRLYISNVRGLSGICFSDDGLNWTSAETGEKISLVPYDMRDKAKSNYWNDSTILEFRNSAWIIRETPQQVYTSSDGITWGKVTVNPEKRFLHRSKAAIAVFKDHIYIAGGNWFGKFGSSDRTYPIVMNDVWRSRDGINWELAAADAGWDKMMNAALVPMGDRLVLFGGDRYTGRGSRFQVWESRDGVNWSVEADEKGIKVLNDAGIRNSFISIARLNDMVYLADRDIVETRNGRTFAKTVLPEDMIEFPGHLGNSVTITRKGREYLVVKEGEEFFAARDFNKWTKMSYNFADDFKGNEDFRDFVLHKIGDRLFLSHVQHNRGNTLTIESISLNIDLSRNAITFTEYKLNEFNKD